MNIRGTPDLGQPSDDPSSGGERERIRQRMKMVIGQLEGILRELKEVAKELREVSEGPDRSISFKTHDDPVKLIETSSFLLIIKKME